MALRHSSAQITDAFAISWKSRPADLPQWLFRHGSARFTDVFATQFGIRLVLTLTFSMPITSSCSPRPGSIRWFCHHHWPSDGDQDGFIPRPSSKQSRGSYDPFRSPALCSVEQLCALAQGPGSTRFLLGIRKQDRRHKDCHRWRHRVHRRLQQ